MKKILDLPVMAVVYLCEVVVRIYFALIVRPKVVYTDASVKSLKFKEATIVILNHTTMLDPLLIMAIVRRPRNILVAKDQYELPYFRWILKRFRAIPIDRFDPWDTSWLSLTKKEMAKGNSILIFPEGKCRTDGLLNEFKSGFAMLARSTGAPVVSVAFDGIYKFGHRTQVRVGNSEKIERVKGVSSSEYLAEKSEYFRQKVWNLKQMALGKSGEILPPPSETPAEVLPEAPVESNVHAKSGEDC